MKLFLKHSLSGCDGGTEQRRSMENQIKVCGKRSREVICIYQWKFLCQLWSCYLQHLLCQGVFVFLFLSIFVCSLHLTRACCDLVAV